MVRYYTYEPFGEVLEEDGTPTNYMMFTGQYFDTEIDQYYLRARQYDPHISRFTARDLVFGDFQEPLTLHRYLYCINDPTNKIDPSGEIYFNVANGLQAAATVYSAGLLIACYGIETENFELVMAGAYVMEFSPLAYALGLGFGDKMVTVTRWGNPGRGAGYVMGGKKSYLNYLLSGKWQRGLTNQYAAYSTGHSWKMMASELGFPKGFKWVFGFFGQLLSP